MRETASNTPDAKLAALVLVASLAMVLALPALATNEKELFAYAEGHEAEHAADDAREFRQRATDMALRAGEELGRVVDLRLETERAGTYADIAERAELAADAAERAATYAESAAEAAETAALMSLSANRFASDAEKWGDQVDSQFTRVRVRQAKQAAEEAEGSADGAAQAARQAAEWAAEAEKEAERAERAADRAR